MTGPLQLEARWDGPLPLHLRWRARHGEPCAKSARHRRAAGQIPALRRAIARRRAELDGGEAARDQALRRLSKQLAACRELALG